MDTVTNLPSLSSQLPQQDQFIIQFMDNILTEVDNHQDIFQDPQTNVNGLVIYPEKGAFTITLSNGKVLLYRPEIVDKV